MVSMVSTEAESFRFFLDTIDTLDTIRDVKCCGLCR